jgi:hypothetical protein
MVDRFRKDKLLVDFEITSGVADMMPKVIELCKQQGWLPS